MRAAFRSAFSRSCLRLAQPATPSSLRRSLLVRLLPGCCRCASSPWAIRSSSVCLPRLCSTTTSSRHGGMRPRGWRWWGWAFHVRGSAFRRRAGFAARSGLAFNALGVWYVLAGRAFDLVEERRRLRAVLVILVALYSAANITSEIAWPSGQRQASALSRQQHRVAGDHIDIRGRAAFRQPRRRADLASGVRAFIAGRLIAGHLAASSGGWARPRRIRPSGTRMPGC